MKRWLTDSNGRYRAEMLIVGFSLLCWGRLFSMDGIWWDDWAWVWHYFGSDNIKEFILPFEWLKHRAVGYILYANFNLFELFGEYTSRIWSIFRFAVFTANALLIYSIAKNVLREKTILPLTLAVIYCSSPVVDHLALVTFNYNLFLFFYLLSVLFSIKSISAGKVSLPYYLPAIFFSFVSMISLESFIFFDALRPLLFLYVIQRGGGVSMGSAVRKSLLYWVPFILPGAAILIEAVLVPQTGAYAGVYSTGSFSFEFIGTVIDRYISSMKYIFLKVYSRAFKFSLIKERENFSVIISMIAAFYAFLVLLKREQITEHPDTHPAVFKEARLAAIFGLTAVVIGLFPYALTREAVNYGHHSRHGLLAAIGASIFFPSFFLTLYYKKVFSRKFYLSLIALLVFFGSLQCNHTIGVYKENWEHQRSIWWQLIWRAPDIKPNTFMIIDMPWSEAPGGGSYVLPPAMNLAYAKSRDKREIFSHYAYELRNAFRTDETNYRGIYNKEIVEFQTFKGLTSFYPKNLIAASYQNGYLYINDEIAEPVSSDWSDVEFMLSNVSEDRIIYKDTGAEFPYRWILGPEPDHDWRYYYQKANALAGRQDFKGIADLYSEAQKKGYDLGGILPQNLMPFINAFYVTGNPDLAGELFDKWAGSPAGSRERAMVLLRPEETGSNTALYQKINDLF